MTAAPLYLDTSVVLRVVLESGMSPEFEAKLAGAAVLLTSRLSLVEAARALLRLRRQGHASETQLATAEGLIDAIWARCEVWELTRLVCTTAAQVAPLKALRTLDALHLATFLLARRRFEQLELVTADERLRAAANS